MIDWDTRTAFFVAHSVEFIVEVVGFNFATGVLCFEGFRVVNGHNGVLFQREEEHLFVWGVVDSRRSDKCLVEVF